MIFLTNFWRKRPSGGPPFGRTGGAFHPEGRGTRRIFGLAITLLGIASLVTSRLETLSEIGIGVSPLIGAESSKPSNPENEPLISLPDAGQTNGEGESFLYSGPDAVPDAPLADFMPEELENGSSVDSSSISGERQERTFYPTKSDPKFLADRFLALIPPDQRNLVSLKIAPDNKSFTLTGPAQIIATADQLIPRMDINLQLSGDGVDYGVASVSDRTAPETPEEEVDSTPYYDPNENRMVRTRWENKNAIFPTTPEERGIACFGADENVAPQKPNTPDVVVYNCPRGKIRQVTTALKTKYQKTAGVMFTSDEDGEIILVYAPAAIQEGIQKDMASIQLYPASETNHSPAIPVDGSRSGNGTSYANGSGTEGAKESFRTNVTPIYKNLPVLEKELQTLFRDRIEKIFPTEKDSQLSPAERERSIYRFVRRAKSGETGDQPSCDILFEPSRQAIVMTGNQALCEQMKTLIETMDQEEHRGDPLRYILLRNADSEKIRNIFKTQNDALRSKSRPDGASWTPAFSKDAILRGSDRLIPEETDGVGMATGLPDPSEPSRLTENETSAPSAEGAAIQTMELAETSGPASGNGKDAIQPSVYFTGSSENGAIRPVRYQEGGGGDNGASAANGTGQVGERSREGELNMISDFVPTVLPDLDIVIIDAPPAEAKRISEMISQIEELAAQSTPEIEIYPLRHVNSLMLGGVLTRLYQEMFLTKQGRVIAYPMQNPNAVLLVGWGKALQSMKDLIQTFDQPIQSSENVIHVISLKYQSAQGMVTVLNQYFPPVAPETGGFAPRIRAIADQWTNSIIVQAAPNDFEEIQRILMELDVNRSKASLEVRSFSLKNTLAEDMRRTLSNAILPAVEGTLPRTDTKFPVLEFLSVDAESKKLITSGIMKDVQITADPNKNQLIVTAPADCMDLIAKLIDVFDSPSPTGQLRVFTILNGDATQLQKTLASLLPTGGGAMPSIPNAAGSTSFVPLRFAVDTRTNSILAYGAPEDLKIIDALITTLDRKDAYERKLELIPLENVRAQAIADAIMKYLNEKQRLELSSETVSDHQLFDSQVIVVPEASSNSIILSATPKNLAEIKEMIKSFDKEPPEVVIQVLIAEVTLTDQEEFGIEAGLQDKVAFDRSVITNVTNSSSTIGNPGYDFIKNNSQGNAYNSGTDSSLIAGQVLNNLGMGRSDGDLGYGGLVLSASSRSVEVVLRALRDKNRLQVLSRPQIQAMNNQQAFILIGQRVPRVSGASTTTYGVTSNVVDANVGLILLVTPRIGKDGRVLMEIGAEKSSLGSSSDAIPVFSSEGQVITSPTIDTRQIMTAVSAQNGETVMLGGMISTTKEKISRGVPYLSDIPVLGWLFRYDHDTDQRRELLIVMTPRVVRNSEDRAEIKRVETSKMSWCLADAMAINGNMGLYDPLNTRETPKRTKLLPFLEMDRMEREGEELPDSTIRPSESSSLEILSTDNSSNPSGKNPSEKESSERSKTPRKTASTAPGSSFGKY